MLQEPRELDIIMRSYVLQVFQTFYIFQVTSEMVNVIQAIYPIYKQMKESSKTGISPSFQLLLQNYLEPSKIRKISSITRRGYPPTASPSNSRSVISSDNHPWVSERTEQTQRIIKSIPQNASAKYPWTTFGLVALLVMGEIKYLGTGTIIGDRYILTARFSQLYKGHLERGDILFVPFFRRDTNEKYVVEKVFPPNKPLTIQEGNPSSTSELRIAILQLNISCMIQQKYGSIGYSFNYFQTHPQPELLIAGINEAEERSKSFILVKGRIQTREQSIQYEQIFEWKYVRGSPFLYYLYGEIFVCGVHVDSKEPGLKKGIKFNKDVYLYNLSKYTFQGYELDLSQNILRDKEINYLKEISLKKAVAVDLEATQIGAAGLKALNRGKTYNLLEEINLNNNKLTDDCIECIYSAPWKSLASLHASHNKLTSQGMKLLCTNTWQNLSKLELNNNPLGTKGIHYLVKSDWLLLQTLNLQSTEVDNYGCQKLRKARFPGLRQLTLRKNQIQSEGVRWLLQADWQQLKYLDLGKNKLREDGVKALLKANWNKLHILRLEINQIKSHHTGSKGKLKSKFKDIIFV